MPNTITIPNPQTKQWRQFNLGPLFGEIQYSKNIDLVSRRGSLRVSRRLLVNTSSSDDADLGAPVACVRSTAGTSATDQWWAVCDTVLFKTAGTDPTVTFAQDAITTTPTDLDRRYSDLEHWEGDIFVTSSDDIHRLAGGTWDQNWWVTTQSQTALTASIYHPIKRLWNGDLAIGDGQYIHIVEKDDAGTFYISYKRLRFPPEYRVVWIRSSNGRAWFGCNHVLGGEAVVFEWDGRSPNYNEPSPYRLGHALTMAGIVKDNIPYAVNGRGQVLKFNGSNFAEYARFPVANEGTLDIGGTLEIAWRTSFSAVTDRLHPNGIDVVNGEIHLLVGGGISAVTNLIDEFPSGVWVLEEHGGERASLVHRYSLSQSVSAGSEGGGTVIDYGTTTGTNMGFLKATNDGEYFICGASIYTDDATTVLSAIFELSKASLADGSRGYFVTPRFQSSGIEDKWVALWLKFRKLDDADDRIIVKYRTDEDPTLDFFAAITWSSTTVFTTTNASFSAVVDGDEVEVLWGRGAGACAQVSGTPSLAGSTYTVTLAEAVAGVSGGARVRVRNWTLAETISNQNLKNLLVRIGADAQWIEFKIELRGDMQSGNKGPEIEELKVVSMPKITSKA